MSKNGVKKLRKMLQLNKIYNIDARDGLKQLDDESIDMMITSPPYFNLRCNHAETIWDGEKNCDHEWGNKIDNPKYDERNPELKKKHGARTGSAINSENWAKGDMGCFCSKCGAYKCELGMEMHYDLYVKHLCDIMDEVKRVLKKKGTCWINLGDTYGTKSGGMEQLQRMKKDTPQYGKIPYQKGFEGVSQKAKNLHKCLLLIPHRVAIEMITRKWILRNTIHWDRPNALPCSADDRFTVSSEYIFFFVKNQKYYFNRQLEPYTEEMNRWGGPTLKADGKSDWDKGTGQSMYRTRNMRPNEEGRNMRTTWTIPTKPFHDAHFSTFPEKLLKIPIAAGCPPKGTILDPFIGSSTTAVVAKQMNRKFIGFEINKNYYNIAKKRLQKINTIYEWITEN